MKPHGKRKTSVHKPAAWDGVLLRCGLQLPSPLHYSRDELLDMQSIGTVERSGHSAHSSPDPGDAADAMFAAGYSKNHLHD
jgi:hypothetical protein